MSRRPYLVDLTAFAADYAWIYDFKITEVLTNGFLDRIPDDWRKCLQNLSSGDLTSLPDGKTKEDWPPSMQTFIHQAVALARRPKHEQSPLELPSRLRRGVTPKKIHEVQQMTHYVGRLCRERTIRNVIDVGAGLGYLGQALHHHYGLRVLGFESEETRCRRASAREESVLSETRSSVRTIEFELGESEANRIDFERVLFEFVGGGGGDEPVCLVGLHCCGDLTPLVLSRFVDCCPKGSTLVCVGCCYHRMSRRRSADDDDGFLHFPLSSELETIARESRPTWTMSEYGLRLAAQETKARWKRQTAADHSNHAKHVVYRATLEAALRRTETQATKKFNKLTSKKDFSSFDVYLQSALNRLELDDDVKEDIDRTAKSLYEPASFACVEGVTALQFLFQPLLEALVTFDRVAYLWEREIDADVVALFDDAISPRNLAIVGRKSI